MTARLVEASWRASAALALAAAWAAALIMLAMTLHILAEIVLRSFFATSTHLVEEYVGYGFMTMIFLGLAHTLERGRLIRVDLVLARLGERARRGAEIAIAALALATTGFLGWFVWIGMARRYVQGTVSMTTAATPLWIPEAIVFAGLALFALQVLLYLIRLCCGGPLIDETAAFE